MWPVKNFLKKETLQCIYPWCVRVLSSFFFFHSYLHSIPNEKGHSYTNEPLHTLAIHSVCVCTWIFSHKIPKFFELLTAKFKCDIIFSLLIGSLSRCCCCSPLSLFVLCRLVFWQPARVFTCIAIQWKLHVACTHTHCFFCVCWGELWHLLCNRTSIFWPFFYDNASDTPVCEREIKVALVASPNSPNRSTIYMLFFLLYGRSRCDDRIGKNSGLSAPLSAATTDLGTNRSVARNFLISVSF